MADKRLDETIPGGWYIGADGRPHDAEGRPLDPADAPPADEPVPAFDVPADAPAETAPRKKKA